MADNKSYVMWNNKGGVGKSTITFHVASVYAEEHPDRDVVVIDMCPQANSSSMLMGGGRKSEEKLQELISKGEPQTIVGYITEATLRGDADLNKYVTKLCDVNENLSENIFLISGDGNLELIAPLLSERAEATPLSAADNPWITIHSIVRELTKKRLDPNRACTFFIDTNPSFAIYTQLAIVGGDKLLVPINADDSSIFAITGLFNLIWGTSVSHPVYGKYTFATKAKNHGLSLPKISYLLGNRFTQKVGAAHAFKALSNEAINKMYSEFNKNPDKFESRAHAVSNMEEFEKAYSIELRDFNSAGVVAANQGLPLSKMDKHTYEVYGEKIQVAKEQRDKCKEAIVGFVKKL
ncbi:ParA family protein [Vibrio tarriae]|uniref:ParA family protein n=1 Tax=Vibrio TaxID=662 RepID=UPI000D3663C8|nr:MULTISPECIES: ParA family protein [Vibrio]EGQ9396146.1 ParA family protein [Vibrio cholerae]EJL7002232.1 ParA family protein [Vibrio cholerae]EKF9165133.1 ParA family protein [Vibrio cholerae]EKF9982514.1 ParA family protein [Vibrio cholerae]EKG0411180.1 ParA family protein [Vibrio cholerae]